MGAEELETRVAIPLETALAGLPDVRRIRSTSQLGVAQVTVEFEPTPTTTASRQLVAERVGAGATQLPPGTDAPLLSSLTGRLNEIFEFTLEAEPGAADLMTLRDLAEFEVKNRLLAVPASRPSSGSAATCAQFQVQLDPDRMAARGVTLDEVMHAVEGANVNAVGRLRRAGRDGMDRARRRPRARRSRICATTVVAVRGGDARCCSATSPTCARRRPCGAASRTGSRGEVVSCRVVKQFGADTVDGRRRRCARPSPISAERCRKGVSMRIVYDQSELVRAALGGVGRAVLIGAALVVARAVRAARQLCARRCS